MKKILALLIVFCFLATSNCYAVSALYYVKGIKTTDMQPIVENSIKHGFDGFIPADGCKIAIKAAVIDDVLEITVRDNGKGIGKEELAKIAEDFSVFKEEEKRDSIGLHNIYRRLKLTNEKNEMTIETEENSFTEIKISIVT